MLSKFIQKRLSLQLTLVVMLVTAGALGVSGIYRYQHQASVLETKLTQELAVSATILAASLTEPIYNYDIPSSKAICHATMKRADIVSISVEELKSVILIFSKNESGEIVKAKYDDKVQDIEWSHKTILRGKQELGRISIGVTRTFLNAELRQTMIEVIVQIVLLELLLALPLVFLLQFQLIIPVQRLMKETSLVSKGKLDFDSTSYGPSEVGELARTFFVMRNNIQKTISRLSEEVSERKRAESELRDLQNYLSNIINSMPSLLVGVDSNCKVTQWNSQAEGSTGISADKATGRDLAELLPRLSDKLNHIHEAIETREVLVKSKQCHTQEGTITYEDITIFPLIANGVQGAVIRIDDVTERVQIEEVMIQSEKMQSVGGLAAGMAHEINNPLAVITQGIQNSLRRLDPNLEKNIEAAKKYNIDLNVLHDFLTERKIITFLNGGRDAVKRAAEIVKNMLMFSRKSSSTLIVTDMAQLMNHTIELGSTDYDMKKKYDFKFVKIEKDYASDLSSVNCCPSEIEQVLLNLFKNALQAMEEITTDGYKPEFHVRLRNDNDFIRIEIEDNGPGIPDHVISRVFEPFFTTKPVGIGTGLGLSVSYMIITQNHRGTFEVETELNKYAKFIIRLPLYQPKTPLTENIL